MFNSKAVVPANSFGPWFQTYIGGAHPWRGPGPSKMECPPSPSVRPSEEKPGPSWTVFQDPIDLYSSLYHHPIYHLPCAAPDPAFEALWHAKPGMSPRDARDLMGLLKSPKLGKAG